MKLSHIPFLGALCLTLLSLSSPAQNTTYSLNYKIAKGKTLTYRFEQYSTSTTVNNAEKKETNSNGGSPVDDEELQRQLTEEALKEQNSATYTISYSNKKGDIIDVEILKYKKDETIMGDKTSVADVVEDLRKDYVKDKNHKFTKKDKALLEYLKTGKKSALKGLSGATTDSFIKIKEKFDFVEQKNKENKSKPETLFRGAVFTNNTIQSFWLPEQQMNLLSMFAKLPNKAVAVGDTWPLNLSLARGNQTVAVDSSYQKDEVKLVSVKDVDGEKVAMLNYDICQYISGLYDESVPVSFLPYNDRSVTCKATLTGIALFSITKGQWKSIHYLVTVNIGNLYRDNISTTE